MCTRRKLFDCNFKIFSFILLYQYNHKVFWILFSPNTPGLRNLQKKEDLKNLLSAVVTSRNQLPNEKKPPLLLKLAPDLEYEELKDIAEIINDESCRIDGIIVSNTTIERPDFLRSPNKLETGGLSGKPLREKSTKMIRDMYKLTNGIPIIGKTSLCTLIYQIYTLFYMRIKVMLVLFMNGNTATKARKSR